MLYIISYFLVCIATKKDFILDHIDGNRFNNKIKNLQLLCPNCHALKDNNSGKAVGNYKMRE